MSKKISKKKAEEFIGMSVPQPAPKKEPGKPPTRPKNMTPEEMFIHFKRFQAKVKTEPYLFQQAIGSKVGVEVIDLEKERPLTMDGFEIFLFEEGILTDLGPYLANRDGRYDAYIPIITLIKKIIRNDQIGGGMAGVYSATITSRLNNLTEKVEQKINGTFDIEMDLS